MCRGLGASYFGQKEQGISSTKFIWIVFAFEFNLLIRVQGLQPPPTAPGLLPGHRERRHKGRPDTAGVASRPKTSARKYNFINQDWGT